MNAKIFIAQKYIQYLEAAELPSLVGLFSEDGIVLSPIYGTLAAKEFYAALKEDTSQSRLTIKGIFEEATTGQVALYFQYEWTLQHGRQVTFDAVDILTFDATNKITNLKIIYDTVQARTWVEELRETER